MCLGVRHLQYLWPGGGRVGRCRYSWCQSGLWVPLWWRQWDRVVLNLYVNTYNEYSFECIYGCRFIIVQQSDDSRILCEYDPCQVGSMRNEPIWHLSSCNLPRASLASHTSQLPIVQINLKSVLTNRPVRHWGCHHCVSPQSLYFPAP